MCKLTYVHFFFLPRPLLGFGGLPRPLRAGAAVAVAVPTSELVACGTAADGACEADEVAVWVDSSEEWSDS